MKAPLFLAWLVVLMTGCVHSTQKVERIPHFSAVRLAGAGAVTIVPASQAIHMISSTGQTVPDPARRGLFLEVTLQRGQSFTLSDGYHFSVTYTLSKITPRQITLKETTLSRPPDRPRAEKQVRIITVPPYSPLKTNPLAPPVKPLSEEEIDPALKRVSYGPNLDRDTLHRALISSQAYLRAMAAKQLGEVGDATSIPHLIDALSDESEHVGANYFAAGMNTTRYWVNDSLKKLTKQDFGFHWDAPKADREAAIKRWTQWFYENYKK